MKNLSKLIFVFILATICTQTYAQQFIIRGGLNLSNMLVKDDDDTYSDNFKLKPGFHAGVTAEFPFSEKILFETGLLLSTKGYKANESETYGETTYDYKESLNLLYLDIPLMAKSYFEAGNMKIYGAFGPYIGYGLSGKNKYETTIGGQKKTEKETIKWGTTENDHLKRLDFGLTAAAGIEIEPLQIGVFYSYGLANISSTTTGGSKASNRILGISVGYKLSSK
jgi:outer membrane protein W